MLKQIPILVLAREDFSDHVGQSCSKTQIPSHGRLTDHVSEGRLTDHVSEGGLTDHVSEGGLTDHVSEGGLTDHVSEGGLTDHVSEGGLTDHVSEGGLTDHVSEGGLTDHVSEGGLTDHVSKGSLFCFVGCLTSQQQASVSQGLICKDNFTCCHAEIEAADQTFYLTQSQYTDTGPTSPSTDPIIPVASKGRLTDHVREERLTDHVSEGRLTDHVSEGRINDHVSQGRINDHVSQRLKRAEFSPTAASVICSSWRSGTSRLYAQRF